MFQHKFSKLHRVQNHKSIITVFFQEFLFDHTIGTYRWFWRLYGSTSREISQNQMLFGQHSKPVLKARPHHTFWVYACGGHCHCCCCCCCCFYCSRVWLHTLGTFGNEKRRINHTCLCKSQYINPESFGFSIFDHLYQHNVHGVHLSSVQSSRKTPIIFHGVHSPLSRIFIQVYSTTPQNHQKITHNQAYQQHHAYGEIVIHRHYALGAAAPNRITGLKRTGRIPTKATSFYIQTCSRGSDEKRTDSLKCGHMRAPSNAKYLLSCH